MSAQISDAVKQACLDHMARLHGYIGAMKLTLYSNTGPVEEYDIDPAEWFSAEAQAMEENTL